MNNNQFLKLYNKMFYKMMYNNYNEVNKITPKLNNYAAKKGGNKNRIRLYENLNKKRKANNNKKSLLFTQIFKNLPINISKKILKNKKKLENKNKYNFYKSNLHLSGPI